MPTPTGKRDGSTTPTFELARREAKLLRPDASAAPLGRSRPEAIAPLDGYGATLGEELQVVIVQDTALGIDHGVRGNTIGIGEEAWQVGIDGVETTHVQVHPHPAWALAKAVALHVDRA